MLAKRYKADTIDKGIANIMNNYLSSIVSKLTQDRT